MCSPRTTWRCRSLVINIRSRHSPRGLAIYLSANLALVVLLVAVVGLVMVLSNRLTERVKIPSPALILAVSCSPVQQKPGHPHPDHLQPGRIRLHRPDQTRPPRPRPSRRPRLPDRPRISPEATERTPPSCGLPAGFLRARTYEAGTLRRRRGLRRPESGGSFPPPPASRRDESA